MVNGDGAQHSLPESDVVVASAGATHPSLAWLRCLRPNGRLAFPMTSTNCGRRQLLVTRHGPDAFEAGSLRPVWF